MNYTARTSIIDLENILNKLGVKNYIICRKGELKNYLKNKKITNYIINLDDVDNGTHWVAMNTTKKLYFDSYAQEKPLEIPKDYKLASTNKELQSIEAEICGQLCCLWLYYVNHKSNNDYYELFKDVY
jgi:hypothetical protein